MLRVITWISFISLSVLVDPGDSIRCYKCIALDCPNERSICKSMEIFARRQIPYLYYADKDLPVCPLPGDQELWERMKSTPPTSYECPGSAKKGEATCILARFQVRTQTTENKKNFTSHGTILGCAKRELLSRIKETMDQYVEMGRQNGEDAPIEFDDESAPYIGLQKRCHTDKVQSPIENSLQHFMEVEHCSISSDMCYNHDYCVEPRESIVKPFIDEQNGNESFGLVTNIFIWTFLVLALIVIVLTFAGIKYDAS